MFFVRVVTNLHLYLICLLNVVGCGFIFVFDLASECGFGSLNLRPTSTDLQIVRVYQTIAPP